MCTTVTHVAKLNNIIKYQSIR